MNITNSDKSKLIVFTACFVAVAAISYAIAQHLSYANRSQQIHGEKFNRGVLNTPFPEVDLIDLSGASFDDDELRRGKVVLVLLSSECDACFTEGYFLKTVFDQCSNVRFYGAILFWSDRSVNQAQDKFPFRLFLDRDSLLRKAFEVKAVPIKLFLKDGIIEQAWTGATTTSQLRNEFIKSLWEICRQP
jgi:hypothetical protein